MSAHIISCAMCLTSVACLGPHRQQASPAIHRAPQLQAALLNRQCLEAGGAAALVQSYHSYVARGVVVAHPCMQACSTATSGLEIYRMSKL